ncbi:carboxyltransferase domain-containing protein [Actinotalea soli]|uniref:5-oxoprolinase subunit B/C family protein n=1 Tax=Actinotalea soli TaxID=2819234 RepID=UPI0027DABB78|nr:carboxyltransferase domain-containing protein [Actinotalea soli]
MHRLGERAVLVECSDLAEVLDLAAVLDREPLVGQRELVPAASTLMVTLGDAAAAHRGAEVLATLPAPRGQRPPGREVTLEVVYDGEDLPRVAELLGWSPEAVVAAHGEQVWTAAFLGFAPGFAYLVGEAGGPEVPRRDSPRTAVPPGSVALAGPYSAVYPRRSPGGWQLVGRTGASVWDVERQDPALLVPGTRVRFTAVRELVLARGSEPPGGQVQARRCLRVLDPGPATLVQDLGRADHLALGVSPSGALDRGAARQVNRAVGNPRSAALLESLGGLLLEAEGDHVLAVAGAHGAVRVHHGAGGVEDAPTGAPFALPAGARLEVAVPVRGLRVYVAARGGLGPQAELGSRSTDQLSGLGPAPLTAGLDLPVLEEATDAVLPWGEPDAAGSGPTDGPGVAGGEGAVLTVRARPGPRADWLTPDARARLPSTTWTVTGPPNRIGLRLEGEPLERSRHDELASEGVVHGAVQVPPSGQPVILLADHPVTGGYPVVAVVAGADLDLLAQLRPGDRLRLAVGD